MEGATPIGGLVATSFVIVYDATSLRLRRGDCCHQDLTAALHPYFTRSKQ